MQNGELVHESYANGGRPGRMQSLASGTKRFIGVAALAAVDDGLIDLDGRVCEALHEWADHPLNAGRNFSDDAFLGALLQNRSATARCQKSVHRLPEIGAAK